MLTTVSYWAYRKSGTRDPGLGTGDLGPGSHRQDLRPGIFMWDLGPETLHLGPFTWDPGPGTWDPRPFMMDPTWNQDQIPLLGTRDSYINTNLGTLTVIQLS